MKKTANIIENFLSESETHILSISQGNKRLSKKTQKLRYGFSLSDIERLYGSVLELLEILPEKGFSNGTTAILRKVYGGENLTYHTHKEIELNFKEEMAHENHTLANPQPIAPSIGMGFTQVPQSDWLITKVKESRFDDIERELKRTQEELLDVRSKLRSSEEKNNHLQMKLDTAEERFELKLQRELLNKRGFFESPAGEKFTEVLGMAAPHLLAMATKVPQVAPAMGNPTDNLSEVKKGFINIISQPNITDEMIQFLFEKLHDFQQE